MDLPNEGDKSRTGTITYYLNDKKLTPPIDGLVGKIYPHLILSRDIKIKLTISSCQKQKFVLIE